MGVGLKTNSKPNQLNLTRFTATTSRCIVNVRAIFGLTTDVLYKYTHPIYSIYYTHGAEAIQPGPCHTRNLAHALRHTSCFSPFFHAQPQGCRAGVLP